MRHPASTLGRWLVILALCIGLTEILFLLLPLRVAKNAPEEQGHSSPLGDYVPCRHDGPLAQQYEHQMQASEEDRTDPRGAPHPPKQEPISPASSNLLPCC